MAALMSMPSAASEPEFGLMIKTDLRADVDRVDEPGFSRNENRLEAEVAYLANEHIRFVGAVDFIFMGFSRDTELFGLTQRSTIDPYFLESDAAYIDLVDVADGLDIRIGRQIVQWGAADMINPTDNLNPDDIEDPLMFGENIANQMLRVDYNPYGSMVFTAVWVPLFTPALLPASATTALTDTTEEMPFASPMDRARGEHLRAIYLNDPDTYEMNTPVVEVDTPDFSFENSQVGVKMAWLAGNWDMSLSYYRGFEDIPVIRSVVSTIEPLPEERLEVNSLVSMQYARIQVLGFDLAGQIPFLDDLGLWFEGAVFFPEEVNMMLDLTDIGEDAEIIEEPTIEDTPFLKATVGTDYTLASWLYLNAQYVRGFIDDFGAHDMGNYIVAGADTKFLSDRLGIRVFGVIELPREDDDIELPCPELGLGQRDSDGRGAVNNGSMSSYMLYPQISVIPWGSLELIAGAYMLFGGRETKFGQIGSGPSFVFFKAQAGF